jgi:integrase/recombinase XerD
VTVHGARLSKSGLRQIVRRCAQRAGLPEPGMHSFRRAFAINSLRNGMDVVTLQRLMGHADLSVIDRYLALLDEDLQRAHRQYGVVDNMK